MEDGGGESGEGSGERSGGGSVGGEGGGESSGGGSGVVGRGGGISLGVGQLVGRRRRRISSCRSGVESSPSPGQDRLVGRVVRINSVDGRLD